MIVDEIIARLHSVAIPPFRLVEGASELAALGTGGPLATPAAYVFLAEEAASENGRVTGVLQRVEHDVAVVIVASNAADPRGAAASSDIEPIRRAVLAALVGWQPPEAADVVTYLGGELVRARDNAVWWQLTFAAATILEA